MFLSVLMYPYAFKQGGNYAFERRKINFRIKHREDSGSHLREYEPVYERGWSHPERVCWYDLLYGERGYWKISKLWKITGGIRNDCNSNYKRGD